MAAQRVADVPANAAEHVVGGIVEVFAVSIRNGNHFGVVLVNVQLANLLDNRFIKLLRAFGRFLSVAAAENNADFGLVETSDMGIGILNVVTQYSAAFFRMVSPVSKLMPLLAKS